MLKLNDTFSSGKRVIFLSRIMTGSHFSTSKNDPRSLFCRVHYSSLHQQELTIFRCFLHYNCVPNCHIHLTARNDRKRSSSGPKQNTPKGRGLGINSSQSKNIGRIQLSMQLSHLNIIFEKWCYSD